MNSRYFRQKLLTHQRDEQSGFTPKKSTLDRILALRVLTECLRDIHTGLLVAYEDFRKALDSGESRPSLEYSQNSSN